MVASTKTHFRPIEIESIGGNSKSRCRRNRMKAITELLGLRCFGSGAKAAQIELSCSPGGKSSLGMRQFFW
jgi:hypothetical protein